MTQQVIRSLRSVITLRPEDIYGTDKKVWDDIEALLGRGWKVVDFRPAYPNENYLRPVIEEGYYTHLSVWSRGGGTAINEPYLIVEKV